MDGVLQVTHENSLLEKAFPSSFFKRSECNKYNNKDLLLLSAHLKPFFYFLRGILVSNWSWEQI